MKPRKVRTGLIVCTLILSLSLLGVGCEDATPVREDLTNYYENDMVHLMDSETEVLLAFQQAAGNHYGDDGAFLHVLTDHIIPQTMDHLDRIQAVTPATPEVEEIHVLYLQAWSEHQEGLDLLVDAYGQENPDLVDEANERLQNASLMMDVFWTQLHDLAEEMGLDLQ